MSLAATSETASSPSSLRIIAAASIGNALEWFDLLVYVYFAVTISRLFFPSSDQTVSLMLAFGTFGASYLVRPLGALVLGAYADKAGRKASLTVSIFLMTLGTLLMAIVPTYASIGAIAPAAILGCSADTRFFSRWRVRWLNFISGRTRVRAEGLFRELPMGGARAFGGARVAVRRGTDHNANAGPGQRLGMARTLFLWTADRSYRLLYPAPRRRNAGFPGG